MAIRATWSDRDAAGASIRCRNASAYDGWSAVLAGGLFIQTIADAASAAAYTRKR